jgi:hypothetical protein
MIKISCVKKLQYEKPTGPKSQAPVSLRVSKNLSYTGRNYLLNVLINNLEKFKHYRKLQQ